MKYDFVGRCNQLIPNTIVLDEETGKWRILLGGVLKIDKYDSMSDAAEAVDRVANMLTVDDFMRLNSVDQNAQYAKLGEYKRKIILAGYIKRMNLHPSIVEQLSQNGIFRFPWPSEWNEDFGLGYANRIAWQRQNGEYTE
jgi:hypothetical protein